MIDIKEAVKKAHEYITNIYPGDNFKNLYLEEVELSEDEKFWLVTFGFDRYYEPSNAHSFELVYHIFCKIENLNKRGESEVSYIVITPK